MMLPTVTDTNIENISRHHWNYPIIFTKVCIHRDSSIQSTSGWPFDSPTDQPECPYLHHQPTEKSSQLQNPHDRTRQQLPPNVTEATYPCFFLPRWCHKRHQPAVPTSLNAKKHERWYPTSETCEDSTHLYPIENRIHDEILKLHELKRLDCTMVDAQRKAFLEPFSWKTLN